MCPAWYTSEVILGVSHGWMVKVEHMDVRRSWRASWRGWDLRRPSVFSWRVRGGLCGRGRGVSKAREWIARRCISEGYREPPLEVNVDSGKWCLLCMSAVMK